MEIKNYFAQDAQGNIMPSANCYLYLPGTTTLATGLVDGNGVPISNPFLASSIGQVTFGAPNGVYDLRISQGARDTTIEIQCADLLQALNETASFLGAKSSSPTTRNDGTALQIADRYFNTADQLEYLYKSTGWVANNLDGQLLATSQGASLLGAIMQDGSIGTVQEAINIGDMSLRKYLASPSGAEVIGLERTKIADAVKTVAQAINTTAVSVWECAHLATGYSIGGDMSTWDWAPAINAASALAQLTKAGVVQFTAHRFNVTTTVRRLDGVSFRGMGDLKGQTAKHEVYDVTTIANVTNSAVVMESQGLTSGPKNIIAHMSDMKVLGNPLTTIVLDLKGFWLSKFSEVFIGGGLTTVWVRSDFPNGFSCYYNSFRDSIISGMNPNNFDQITNVYGLRLTNDADEFFMDNVQILNASNAFSVESGSYCHIGYVNIEYSSVNHTPIYIDSVNSVIADLRCDPHRPMTRPFLHLGPNSGGNSIKLKTFESLRVTQVQGYYVKDEGRFNVVDAGQYGTDYQPGRNLVPNPDLVLTGTLRHGWVKSASVGISSSGVYRTQRVTKIELLAAETLGNANTLIDVPLDTLSLGDTVLLDCYIKVDSPSALVGFTDAGGFIPADGNISGQILSLPNSGGAFQRLRRAFVLTALPVGNLRLSIYPCRAAAGSVTPTIGDSVSISCLSVDIIDPWAASARNALAQDGTVPLLADLTNRMPAAGLVLTTPDGTKTFRLNVDNAGQIISTRVL